MTEPAPIGHNTPAGDQLRALIERVERLEAEKGEIATDIRELYAEAKGKGFDPKVMRQVVRLRKMDQAQREEDQAVLEMYLHSLGML